MLNPIKLLERYPKPEGKRFRYGTAGFREKHSLMSSVILRMGMLAWFRAAYTGKAVGLMITASHNLVEDNGVKLIDPDGGMLEASWEKYATELANIEYPKKVLEFLSGLAKLLNIPFKTTGGVLSLENIDGECIQTHDYSNHVDIEDARVFFGFDTRPHSSFLSTLAKEGAQSLDGKCMEYGVLTTPQLHFIVQHNNLQGPGKEYASEDGYYSKLAMAYRDLVGNKKALDYSIDFIVDAGFGVGGIKFEKLLEEVNKQGQYLNVIVRNVASLKDMESDVRISNKLNNGVGAEYVQKKRMLPKDTYLGQEEKNVKFASFDGDADRIVYFFVNDSNEMVLLDGDKIASLMARFLKQQVSLLPGELQSEVRIAVVQTAYANGAATSYLNNTLGLETPLVATGVKHCHHMALKYDIGIYFEANGHGTVLFKTPLIEKLRNLNLNPNNLNETQREAIKRLLSLSSLINQATGDAMADALAVEGIIKMEGITMHDFAALYEDLPSRQLKVKVKDRNVIETTLDESKVVSPKGLQEEIDNIVQSYNNGRAFVRPSGTEDVVRIYAEAETQALADEMALKVCQKTYDIANGVGERPK